MAITPTLGVSKIDLYDHVTSTICAALEAGTVPWRRPWKSSVAKGRSWFPRNRKTKKRYRGINVCLLDMAAMAAGYATNDWLTFQQAKDLGGSVRKGEKSTPGIFWKLLDVKDKSSGKDAKIPMLNRFCLFNAAQCDGLPEVVDPEAPVVGALEPLNTDWTDSDALTMAESICDTYRGEGGPPVRHGGDRASYSPWLDEIKMPEKRQFIGAAEYYCTIFHEMGHSTGHASRLKRDLDGRMGSNSYSKEELIAEMTAAFLCRLCEIDNTTIENSASYIQCWLKTLREPGNKKLVVCAAGAAQRAFDLIVGEKFESEEVAAA